MINPCFYFEISASSIFGRVFVLLLINNGKNGVFIMFCNTPLLQEPVLGGQSVLSGHHVIPRR